MFEVYINFFSYINSKIETGIMVTNENEKLVGDIRHEISEYLNIDNDQDLILLDTLGLTVLDDDNMTLATLLETRNIVIHYEHSDEENMKIIRSNSTTNIEVNNKTLVDIGIIGEHKMESWRSIDNSYNGKSKHASKKAEELHEPFDINNEEGGGKRIKAIEISVALNRLADRKQQRTRFSSMERLGLIMVKVFGSGKRIATLTDIETLDDIKWMIYQITDIPTNYHLLYNKNIGFMDDDRFDGDTMLTETGLGIYQERPKTQHDNSKEKVKTSYITKKIEGYLHIDQSCEEVNVFYKPSTNTDEAKHSEVYFIPTCHMEDIKQTVISEWGISCLQNISLQFLTKSELIEYDSNTNEKKEFVRDIKNYVCQKYRCLQDELVCMVDGKEVLDDESLMKIYVENSNFGVNIRPATEVNAESNSCGSINKGKIKSTENDDNNKQTASTTYNDSSVNNEDVNTCHSKIASTSPNIEGKSRQSVCNDIDGRKPESSDYNINVSKKAITTLNDDCENTNKYVNNTACENTNDIEKVSNCINNIEKRTNHQNTTLINTLRISIVAVKKYFPISVTCLNCTLRKQVLTFNVSPSDTVGHLKELIERETGIPSQTIQITHDSAPIQDDADLLYHHILAPLDSDIQKITFNMVSYLNQHRTTFTKVHTVNLRFLRRCRRRGRTAVAEYNGDQSVFKENQIKREEKLLYAPRSVSDAESVEVILYSIRKLKALKKPCTVELLLDGKLLDNNTFIKKLDVLEFECNVFKI